MSAMTRTSISECSFPDSEVDTLDESIERTCSKMRTAFEGVVLLQKQLRELVAMRKENAIEQFNKAKQHLELIEQQESALSIFLGEDGRRSSLISHHGDDDGSDSPLKDGKDLVDQSQSAQKDHPDIDLGIQQGSLEGQYPDLNSMITGGDVIFTDGTGDDVPAHKSGEGEGSNPLSFLDDSTNLERLNDANLSEMIIKNQMNKKILEEERKRREEARGLAMLAKAEAELSALKAERESMRVRNEAIAVLEQEIHIQREKGLQLAPMAAPPPKAPETKKKGGKVVKRGSGIIRL